MAGYPPADGYLSKIFVAIVLKCIHAILTAILYYVIKCIGIAYFPFIIHWPSRLMCYSFPYND